MTATSYDPNRLLLYVARCAFSGVVAGFAVLLALLWLDVGGIGSRVAASADRELITAMLAGAFGCTFALPGILWGVLVKLPHES
ncbi:MAG: hypothetical protein ACJA1L_002912 [Paracoccaceae bacterium]|jgi:hypothetical protein